MRSCLRRKDFGDEARADGPFASDTHRNQKPEHSDMPERLREKGEAGKNGIGENGDGHRRLATPAIGQRPKKQAPSGATKQKKCKREVAIAADERIFSGNVENAGKHLVSGNVEDLAFIYIENPAGGGDGEDQPLVG